MRTMTIALALLCGVAAGAQQSYIAAGVDTKGFVGMSTSYESRIMPNLGVGGYVRASALMLSQGDADTYELGAFLRRNIEPTPSLRMEGEARAAYSRQNQALGLVRSLAMELSLRCYLTMGRAEFGLEMGWDEAVLTGIEFSEFTRSTFYGGSTEAPLGALIYFASGRLRAGPAATLGLGRSVSAFMRGGLAYVPNPYVGGFDGMAFGFFPFYAELGIRVGF